MFFSGRSHQLNASQHDVWQYESRWERQLWRLHHLLSSKEWCLMNKSQIFTLEKKMLSLRHLKLWKVCIERSRGEVSYTSQLPVTLSLLWQWQSLVQDPLWFWQRLNEWGHCKTCSNALPEYGMVRMKRVHGLHGNFGELLCILDVLRVTKFHSVGDSPHAKERK